MLVRVKAPCEAVHYCVRHALCFRMRIYDCIQPSLRSVFKQVTLWSVKEMAEMELSITEPSFEVDDFSFFIPLIWLAHTTRGILPRQI